ncbi:hypothetical protein [Modestobacter sp. URMC 112]
MPSGADDVVGRRRTLNQIHGTGQVSTAIVELDGNRVVRTALPPGALHHAHVLTGRLLAGPMEDLRTLVAGDFVRSAGDVPLVLRSATETTAVMQILTTVPQVQQSTPA